jgi:ribosomal protein L7/L12
LLRAGRPGKAIDHLQAYLREAHQPEDGETVKKLLAEAQAEVARWN